MNTSTVKKNPLPPGLVSNLQEVLNRRNGQVDQSKTIHESTVPSSSDSIDSSKPIVLVTNGDGIESPGLTYLVQALVENGLYNVHVCAPQSDKSMSGHSVTVQETIAVTPAEIKGATAYGVSGTPVDCVSLALSGVLFSWSKPMLVISGVNRGSSCGHHMSYSSVVAAAREALICGVPSISISLNWQKDESEESNFKDAVFACLPLISAAIRDIEKGIFPKGCSLKIEVPTCPSTHKGVKTTRQSMWRSTASWQAISANRHPAAGRFMSNQQSLGIQLAQLGRDASAAGAARRATTQRKLVEVESVGVAGNSDSKGTMKYYRLEFVDKEQDDADEDLDFRALENGFVAVTPLFVSSDMELESKEAVSEWISSAVEDDV